MKKCVSLILALAMLCSLLPVLSVSTHGAETGGTYTYDTYVSAPPTDWSPTTKATSSDKTIRNHIQTPLWDISVKDSSTGEFQWIFLAAESVTDVTTQQDEATGSVFEIVLNRDLCWEDGTPINADTYIWSMRQILDPDMQYATAEDYYDGDTAIAGARAYAFGGRQVYESNDATNIITSEYDLVLKSDGNYYTYNSDPLYIGLNSPVDDWLIGNSLKYYVDALGDAYFDVDAYARLEAMADENYYVVLNPETLRLLQAVISNANWGESPEDFFHYIGVLKTNPLKDWSTVGLEKVDSYTLRYACQGYCSRFVFLRALQGSNWLIHRDTYEDCKYAGTYCTDVNTTVSYGPYKLKSADMDKVVLIRNAKHFEYTIGATGKLSSETSFEVDGSYVPQWQMDTIVIHTESDGEAIKSRFLDGELDIWNIPPIEIVDYLQSPALHWEPGGTTFCLMVNTSLDALRDMDAYYGGTNSVVLSNENFRMAFSLCLDRANHQIGSISHLGTLGLISDAFYYDAEYDPASVYRKSDAAMQAICDLYDVKYGTGTPYATLAEAYASIDGYDPNKARALMAKACDELVAAGLYTRGEPIVLTYATSVRSNSTDQITADLAAIFNKAAQGSGFGTITVSPRECGNWWSEEIREGKAAMMLGGWSQNILDPFTAMNLFLDPDRTIVPRNMDTTTEKLTLKISGKNYTMTWYEWGQSIIGATDQTNLYNNVEALAKLEAAYLKKMFAIPVWVSTSTHMLGYQVGYYTREYSSMYGFGGTRLMRFQYTDDQWDDYVSSGKLDYTQDICQNGHDYENGICTRCGHKDPSYVEVVATGWSGATEWTLTSDGTLTVYGEGNMKNYGWGGDHPWRAYGDRITSIVIQEGVISVGNCAFMHLAALESVTLPASGLKTIGEAAFYGCSSLEEIYIPDGIYTIWEYTFKNCTSLENVRLPKTLIKIDQGAFEACISLTELFLPTNTQIIGGWSFKGCTSLESVDMQWADATEIRAGAFKNCAALTDISLPENIQILGDSCFYGIGATSFTVPDTVTRIDAWCFARAYSLKNLYFEGDAPTIGTGAFNKITLTAHYPGSNITWTAEIMQDYGGTVTWKKN